MRNIKRISIIALLLLVVGIIGVIFTFKSPISRADWITEETIINNEGLQHIIIIADNADIEVLSTKDKAVTIEVSGSDPINDLSAVVEDSTLSIKVKHSRNRLFQFDLFSSVSSIKVSLPEELYDSIEIKSDNGRIRGNDFQGKDISVETDNGIIDLKHVASSTISVESDNGKISLEDIEGEIYGKTDNGAITLLTSHLDRNIELKTDIGMIEVKTENEPTNATIEANVDIGSVSIFGKNNRHTVYGKGENLIKLTTDIGQIKVTN